MNKVYSSVALCQVLGLDSISNLFIDSGCLSLGLLSFLYDCYWRNGSYKMTKGWPGAHFQLTRIYTIIRNIKESYFKQKLEDQLQHDNTTFSVCA